MSSDARKRAEEALLYNRTHANSPRVRAALVEALEALLAAEPAPPAGAEVREAAERLRASLVAVPSWEALLPKNCGACEGESDCAGEHEPCGCHETLAVIEASLALLAALRATASPAPGSEEVREAEAVLAEAREALDEIRRRSTDKLAGGIAASFLGAHPRAALRGVQKGEVG